MPVKIHEAPVGDFVRPYPFEKRPDTDQRWDDVLRIYDGWQANINHLRPMVDRSRASVDHWLAVCAHLCERLGVEYDDIFWAETLEDVSRICDSVKSK